MTASGATPLLQYWVAGRPIPGQGESGDQYVVTGFDKGTLIAVIDGLGHGPAAAHAAHLAAATLAAHAHESVERLVRRCHEKLRPTRGAVMSIVSLHETGSLTWIGIGNVEAMLLRAAEPEGKPASLLLRGGIVGDRLPGLMTATLAIAPGDLLLLATDGIGSAFMRDIRQVEHPARLVNHIFMRYAKTTDDALVLGAQWTEGNATSINR